MGIAFYEGIEASDTNFRSMWGASNKATQYAAYGMGLLCSTAEPEMRTHLEIGAKFCDMHDPDSIARAISEFIESPVQLNRMGSAIHSQALKEWTFEVAIEGQGVRRALGL